MRAGGTCPFSCDTLPLAQVENVPHSESMTPERTLYTYYIRSLVETGDQKTPLHLTPVSRPVYSTVTLATELSMQRLWLYAHRHGANISLLVTGRNKVWVLLETLDKSSNARFCIKAFAEKKAEILKLTSDVSTV
jgi:hypothetical protein